MLEDQEGNGEVKFVSVVTSMVGNAFAKTEPCAQTANRVW